MLDRLRGRRSDESVPAPYARVLDGETLWLALSGDAPAVTLRYDGGELSTATEPEPGDLVSARVPLAPLGDVPGERLSVAVLAGEGRRTAPISWVDGTAPGPVRVAIPTRDRRWRWQVVAPGDRLGLVRASVDRGIAVLGISTDPDGDVWLELDGMAPMHVSHGDQELTAGGLPLVRAFDDLRRPNHAVALPELPDGSRLRWTPEGRLSLTREVPHIGGVGTR